MPMSKTKELFCTFFKIGAFTFGGGYAMVALLEHEFVEEKRCSPGRSFWIWSPLPSPPPALWR